MSKSVRNAVIVTSAYFVIFWGVAFPCDFFTEVHKSDLSYICILIAALFALVYVPLEKRLCDDEHTEYNGIVVIMSLVFLAIAYLLAFNLIGPQLISYYKEQGIYKKTYRTDGIPALDLDGIQFAFYYLFYVLGTAAGLVFKLIDHIVTSIKERIKK